MPLLCPRCRAELSPAAPICPEHDLHGVQTSALVRAEDAPLLGYVIDGRYALLDYIGGGGMGAVYKGRQLSVGRDVAVKVLHASLTATREDRQRFEDEARAISVLQSPHTVTLYDFGLVREGPLRNLAFMVMEFVEGETLTRRLRADGPMAPETVLGVLEGLADALDEAHAHGIVHRDLKPANILLSYDHRGTPQVKVIDFGVARMGDARELTQTGFSVGTPSYMAPEQFDEGSSRHIDGRADVYALGVVAYLLLTGTKPFRSSSVLELGRMHRRIAPPGLPGAENDRRQSLLTRVLHRAMAKQPENRFDTVGAFAKAFAKVLAGAEPSFSSVQLAAYSPAEDFPTPTESFVGVVEPSVAHTRSRNVLVASIAIGALLGGLAAFMLLQDPPPPERAAARPVIARVDGRRPPSAATPATTASASVATAVSPAIPASAAPKSVATVARAPATAAPKAPRTKAARRSTKRQVLPDPRIRSKRLALKAALNKCRCRPARVLLDEIEGMRGGRAVARGLRKSVDRCLAPDVDEICVKGEVKPR